MVEDDNSNYIFINEATLKVQVPEAPDAVLETLNTGEVLCSGPVHDVENTWGQVGTEAEIGTSSSTDGWLAGEPVLLCLE